MRPLRLRLLLAACFTAVAASGCGTNSKTTQPATPTTPDSILADGVSPSQIDVTWADESGNEEGFEIQWHDATTTAFTVIDTVGPNVEIFQHAGLASGSLNSYRVRAFNSAGPSSFTPTAEAITMNESAGAPNAPSALAATTITSSGAHLQWVDNASDELGYRVERDNGHGSYTVLANLLKDTSHYDLTGLQPATIYRVRILAYNGVGASNPSNEVTIRTAGAAG